MVTKLTDLQIKTFKESFDVFDKNGDGTITTKEFVTVMKSLGQNPSKAQIQNMIHEFDKNRNGRIEFHEFCDLMAKRGADFTMSFQDLENAFKAFDKDGSGFIEPNELRDLMRKLGEKLTDDDIKAMMQLADTNKDGKIDYNEFVKIMM